MSRAKLFKKFDVERALKSAREAGHRVERFEIDQAGKIIVVLADERTRDIEQSDESEWRLP
jgi:hypothetical protein